MANKYDVLARLEAGMTPQQIADELGCSDAYVRATRQRATEEGRKQAARWKAESYQRQKAKQEAIRAST
jgi:DNA-binding CsgD family transcriptional regulator